MPQGRGHIADFKGASRAWAGSEAFVTGCMNFPSDSPTVDIVILVKPESELRLSWLSIPDREPVTLDFNDRRLAIGLGSFIISSEVGEITTEVLLGVEYRIDSERQRVDWHLVATPRPALAGLVEAMEKLVLAEGGEAVRKQAFRGRGSYSNLKGAW